MKPNPSPSLFDTPRQVMRWRARLLARGVELLNRATDAWRLRCLRCGDEWNLERRKTGGRPPAGYGWCPRGCSRSPPKAWTTITVTTETALAVEKLAALMAAQADGHAPFHYAVVAVAIAEAIDRRQSSHFAPL